MRTWLLLVGLFVVSVVLSVGTAKAIWPFPTSKPWKWSATSIVFAPQRAGQPGPPVILALTNTGSKPLAVKLASIDEPFGAEMPGTSGNVLDPKAQLNISLYFYPHGPDSYHGFLKVSINGTVDQIPLSGEGN